MKVIFLDVDGELTYSKYRNSETANIDIEKVKLLKNICDNTGAKVVISSSWRGYDEYTPKIYNILIDILTNNHIDVIGKTPYIPSEFDGEEIVGEISLDEIPEFQVKFGTGRAAEVHQWIIEHDVDSFVILDDEDWQWNDYGYDKYWIQPTWLGDGGLKPEHVEEAINILNKRQSS